MWNDLGTLEYSHSGGCYAQLDSLSKVKEQHSINTIRLFNYKADIPLGSLFLLLSC